MSLVQDGLLSYTMRELANMPDDNPKWILLDGDLDANWVESMNSVMDDSRLLTLPSNERIRLLPHMKMIFEIRDLKYATPVRGALTANLSLCKHDTTYAVGGEVKTSICRCPGAGSTGSTNGTERAHNHSIAWTLLANTARHDCWLHTSPRHTPQRIVTGSCTHHCWMYLPVLFRQLQHVLASCTSVRAASGTTWCRVGCRRLPSRMLRRPSGRSVCDNLCKATSPSCTAFRMLHFILLPATVTMCHLLALCSC